jgi:hypothetical protein
MYIKNSFWVLIKDVPIGKLVFLIEHYLQMVKARGGQSKEMVYALFKDTTVQAGAVFDVAPFFCLVALAFL